MIRVILIKCIQQQNIYITIDMNLWYYRVTCVSISVVIRVSVFYICMSFIKGFLKKNYYYYF